MSTKTPRTDAATLHPRPWPESDIVGPSGRYTDASFSRELERELNAAKQRIAELEGIEAKLIQTRGSLHCQTEFANKWQYSWYTEGREGRAQVNYSVEDTPFKAVSPTPLDRPDAGWQPIETAPRDGTKILGVHDQGRTISTIAFSDSHWRLALWGSYIAKPTHWIPLPANPPAEPVREEQP